MDASASCSSNPGGAKPHRPHSISLIALLMVLFGVAEVATGVTHKFFGISTTDGTASAFAGVAIGALYVLAGLFVWFMKRWGAVLALICLAADVCGRIWMAVDGLYPMHSAKQVFAMVAGTTVVIVFGIYIGLKWKSFR